MNKFSKLKADIAVIAIFLAAVLITSGVLIVNRASPSGSTLRLGYFPNMTHGQALYGVSTGLFQQYIGDDIKLETVSFNAGPTAIEALLTNQIDIIYVGPSPTISGLVASGSDVLRIISGCASGGALFVIRSDLGLNSAADYSGKKFASPQAGNTQDVALKHYIQKMGHTTKEKGGDVDVINAANPDILMLFMRGQIDGAWVPEPWATRLILEGGGKVVLDERELWPNGEFVTTHIVTTKTYLESHRELVQRFLNAHVEATIRIQSNSSAAMPIINDAIGSMTGKKLTDATISESFKHLNFTYDPEKTSFATQMEWSKDLGFISTIQETNFVYDLKILNEILRARSLPMVS